MKSLHGSKSNTQLFWGIALTLMGVAVFFRIPQVMPKLAETGQSETAIWFIRICFYAIGFILIGGGVRKLINHFKKDEIAKHEAAGDNGD